MRFKKSYKIVLIVTLTLLSITGVYADTIDVWNIKINNKIVIRSNVVEIMQGKPMLLNLNNYLDIDTVKICYWTDSGLERYKWSYIFNDFNNNTFEKYTNKIDSTITCWGGPCETYTLRKIIYLLL